MIEIPVHNEQGEQVSTLQLDEQQLGGEVRPVLLKQAYVRFHANRRQGSATTLSRGMVKGSTRKIYKQKGTGNARHGGARVNLMRGGGHTFAKQSKSWRQRMPKKMRRLANRNALLAKAVDGEIKLVESFSFDKPNTKRFQDILEALKIDRTCLIALSSTTGNEALSTRNMDNVTTTFVDRLNAFDLLNHRYLVADKATLEGWISGSNKTAEAE